MDKLQEQRFVNVSRSRTFSRLTKVFSLNSKKVLDVGCGNGEFLAHFGAGSLGLTLDERELAVGQARNLPIKLGNIEDDSLKLDKDYNVLWANNLFEHLLAPHGFLIKIKSLLKDKGILILGVPVVPGISSLLRLKKFKGSLASNHINFFTVETLKLTVERAGWEIKEARSFRLNIVWLDKLLNIISPHIYIIAQVRQGFKYPDKKVAEWRGSQHYDSLLKNQ